MHICFICSEFPKDGFPHGGIGTMVNLLGQSFVEKGIKVSVVGINNYTEKEETEMVKGFPVYRLKSKKQKGLQWHLNAKAVNRKIKAIHQKTPIDFVETPELGLAFIKKLPNVEYVIRMNGGHHFFALAENRKTEQLKVIQEKRSFKKADHLIAVSDFVGQKTTELLDLKKPYTVIFNPVDVSKFYQANPVKVIPHSLFFAGTLVEKKGIRQLIQAMSILVDRFPDVHLNIAGREGKIPGTQQPYRPVLDKEINDKIKGHITFLGVIPNKDLTVYIEKSELCCYPSHMEAMPLAWLEVLGMGKMFVGSHTGPGVETVEDGKTGLLANPHDPVDIAAKITWAFEHPKEAEVMGKGARQAVLEKFNLEAVVKQNMDFYQALLTRRR